LIIIQKYSILINNLIINSKKPIKKIWIKYKTSLPFNLTTNCNQQEKRMMFLNYIIIKMNNNNIYINLNKKRKEVYRKYIIGIVQYVKIITNY
jgi:hypothetical protein